MASKKPPEKVAKDQVIQVERSMAYIAAQKGGFIDHAEELEEFVRHIVAAINLEHMDHRLIEGDER